VSVLRRDREAGWIGGVAAGIARRYGVDVSLVRLAFVVATAAGGFGLGAYLLGWMLIPPGDSARGRSRLPTGRAAVEVALGTGLLLLAVLLTFRGLGFWFSDAVVWPLVLIAGGGALLWRQSLGSAEPAPVEVRAHTPPAPDADANARLAAEGRRAAAAISRTGLGVALVIAAGFVFLQATGALGAARDVLLAVIAAVVVLGVIFAPWILRLVRSLTQERSQRIRSQERAEMAAHLHDSVLQTLAMVQRSAGDPTEVAAIARRQERELRGWLAGRPSRGSDPLEGSLAVALEAAAADVEERHGVPVEVVVVGDRELDANHEAIVAAAREAMTNAAKFGGGATVDVYAESVLGRTQVFIRDRGPGFDPASVAGDRRGVRDSIVGRMERHGGRARVTSAPGGGTEVELLLEERQ
jgi:signal transduction histidine kinase/phage shock protein PspC (stress-responsive transcriptional regulator)